MNKKKELEKIFCILEEKSNSDLTIEEILKILAGNERLLMLIFFIIPFCQPIQIPGLSTPVGILISFIGLQIAFNWDVYLPNFILKKTISKKNIHRFSSNCLWLIQQISKIIAVRWKFVSQNSFFKKIHGMTIFLSGLFLALPLPIPLSNLAIAWSILFMSIGLLFDNGLLIIMGYIINLVYLLSISSLVYFIIKAWS